MSNDSKCVRIDIKVQECHYLSCRKTGKCQGEPVVLTKKQPKKKGKGS